MFAGPFTFRDLTATPTQQPDGEGGFVPVWPARAGLYYITDAASFAAHADALTPYRVSMVPAQAVMAGDDPADPQATVTLHFADAAAAAAVVGPLDALPPIPAPPPVADPPAAPVRRVLNYRFRVALSGFPSVTGDPARTLRDDYEATLTGAPIATRDRADAPEYYRNDPMLIAQATALAGGDEGAASALLDAVFDAADRVP